MEVAQGSAGRIFVLRLGDGDTVPECIERFAAENNIAAASCLLLGGVGSGRLIVGPEQGDTDPIVPMPYRLEGVHEIAAVGTIFPTEAGTPRLHMHAALGRKGDTRTGCVRDGIDIWKIGEVVIQEIVGTSLVRRLDPATGFELLSLAD